MLFKSNERLLIFKIMIYHFYNYYLLIYLLNINRENNKMKNNVVLI